jgi:hypothetical protein
MLGRFDMACLNSGLAARPIHRIMISKRADDLLLENKATGYWVQPIRVVD